MIAVLWQYRRASCEAHALASDCYALLFVCLAVFMTDCNDAMNLKLNNDVKSISSVNEEKSPSICVKEERRRTGRYIAILVGISLFILALYHAWVRRIPVVASLVVPALIMFVYVAWVLYTASRDKRRFRLFDVELGCGAQSVSPDFSEDLHISDLAQNNAEISPPTNKDSQNSPETSEVLYTEKKIKPDFETGLRLPIILVNDKPPEDLDQKWLHIVESSSSEKLRSYRTRRRYKRKFCRSKRNAAFKRSYSIG